MKLDVNADIVDMQELAEDLIRRIKGWELEQPQYDEDSTVYHYINGLISAYETVLMLIGADTDV